MIMKNNTDNCEKTIYSNPDSLSYKIYKFNHYGFTYNEFNQIKDMVYQEDYNISKILNNMFMFVMFIFLGLSVMKIVPLHYCSKYAFFALFSFILKLITIAWDNNHDSYLHFSSRCFTVILLSFGIVESVSDPNVVATAILPLFVICSTVCANSFLEFILTIIVSVLAFLYSSYVVKVPSLFHGDMVNSFTFCLISIILHYYFQKSRVERFFINRQLQDAKKQISINATFDILSGALNRGAFTKETNKIFEKEHGPMAVCLLDIDDFKYINDNFGHDKGDKVIEAIGESIIQSLDLSATDYDTIIDGLSSKNCDYYGRLGGDEFFIVIRKEPDRKNVVAMIEFLQGLVHDITIVDHHLSFSMGVMLVPSDVHDFHDVYAKVDYALYKSKEDGKDRYTFYSPDQEHQLN